MSECVRSGFATRVFGVVRVFFVKQGLVAGLSLGVVAVRAGFLVLWIDRLRYKKVRFSFPFILWVRRCPWYVRVVGDSPFWGTR